MKHIPLCSNKLQIDGHLLLGELRHKYNMHSILLYSNEVQVDCYLPLRSRATSTKKLSRKKNYFYSTGDS